MRAIVLRAYGDVANLREEDWPPADPQQGEVRIRIRAASFNPVDYKVRQGRFTGQLPVVLGIDAAGVIDAVGAGVADFNPGDEVYAYAGGPKSNGTYAECICLPASFVARKPANLSFPQAAALPLVGLTAYESIVVKAKVQPGESVFIAGGAGGVGSMAIQLARHVGAQSILTTAGNDRSFEFLTGELGVAPEHILRYRGLSLKQLREQTLKMNGGRPVNASFDFWGGDMKRLCSSVVGFDGRVVSIVEEPAGFDLNVWNAARSPMFARSASLHFEFVGARAMFGGPDTWTVYQTELVALARLIEGGQLKLPNHVDVGEFSADAARRAHTMLEEGHVRGKLVMSVP